MYLEMISSSSSVRRPWGVREAAEAHQLPNRQLRDEVVFLPQDGDNTGQILRLGLPDVVAGDLDCSLVHVQQAADHGQKGGLAGAVRPDQGGDAARGDLQVDGTNVGLAAVAFRDVL